MSITNNILKVQNTQGAITSIVDRGSDAKLVNQEYDVQKAVYAKSKGNTELREEAVVFSYPSEEPNEEIPLDVVVRYTPEVSTTITTNPTQMGINVNDHVFSNPDTVTVVFGTSDIKGTYARLKGLVKTFSSIDALKNPESPCKALLSMLYRAKNEHTLFTLDDGLHAYTDMVITNITYDRDKSTYRSLVATVTLQQFIFVDNLTNSGGAVRTAPVPGKSSTFASVWDKITSIRLV